MFGIFNFKKTAIICANVCLLTLFLTSALTHKKALTVSSSVNCRLPVVMYHQVCLTKSIYGDYVIPPDVLESDFQYLSENGYTPVSVKQLREFVNLGTPLPEKPILITFDDGQRSFLTRVVPLLEKYNFPAVANVVGSLCELYTESGDTNDSYAYLNESDLRVLSENPLVEIGCHTYEMHSLNGRRGMGRLKGETDEQYSAAINGDFERFDEKISAIIGKTDILAYPYGIENDTVRAIASDKGYTVTFTCRECVNTLTKGGELLELGRYNRPYGVSAENFFNKLNG